MKRSQINHVIRDTIKLLKDNNIALPFFGYMGMEEWRKSDIDFIQFSKRMLGWDVTDFGSDCFEKTGAVLFTLRNGDVYDKTIGTPYAEKYIVLKESNKQEIPMHFHKNKTEDIINRAGGTLMIQVYASLPDGEMDKKSDVTLYLDGIKTVLKPGEIIKVTTGNSVTLTPYVYHRFFAEDSDVIVGEVSSINDDNTDNVFYQKADRFIELEEDVPAEYVLVNEYDKLG